MNGFGSDDQENIDHQDDGGVSAGAALVLGVINIVLVIICTNFRVKILSTGLLVFLMLGFYGGYCTIKEGFDQKRIKGMIAGVLGLLLNAAAAILYAVNIIGSLI